MYRIEGDKIIVGEFEVGKIKYEDGGWCAYICDIDNIIVMRYDSRRRKNAVEGLLKQMIYNSYNDKLD